MFINLFYKAIPYVFALILVYMFRNSLNELIASFAKLVSKTQKAKATIAGVDIELSISSQLQQYSSGDLTKAFQSQFVVNEEKCIRQSLTEKNLNTESEISGLIHYVAQHRLTIVMLLIDKFITQKHIEVLVYLNSINQASKEFFQNDFDGLQDFEKKVFGDFSGFLNALIEKNLIMPIGQNYQITPLGTEYIKFRAQFRFPLVFDKR